MKNNSTAVPVLFLKSTGGTGTKKVPLYCPPLLCTIGYFTQQAVMSDIAYSLFRVKTTVQSYLNCDEVFFKLVGTSKIFLAKGDIFSI